MNSYVVVGVERRGLLLLAIILKNNNSGKKIEVYTQDREKISIAEKKILWNFNSQIKADNEKSMRLKIAELIDEYAQQQIDIPTLWELLDEGEIYTLENLLQVYFTDYTNTDAGSLFVALGKNPLYFKLNNGKFEKNSQQNVEANLQRIHNEKMRQQQEDLFIKWFLSYHGNKDIPEEFVSLLEKAKTYALYGDLSSSEVKKVGSLLGKTPDEMLLLLENKEVISKNINQVVYRQGLQTKFSPQVMSEVEEIIKEEVTWEGRRVVSDIWNIAIDDKQTEEVDDAISLHEEDGLSVVGVHIADVESVIKKDSALDSMAEDRFATVYFLDGKVPLFPMELVKKRLTLAEDSPRATISGFFHFDYDGTLQKSKFEKTVLSLRKRATYEDSLGELGKDDHFCKLHEIAQKIRELRCEKGAIITNFPDTSINIEDENDIKFKLTSATTPAHTVVSEFMIYFNHILAQTMAKKGIPAFYRIQSINNPVDSLVKDNPVYPIQLRRCLGGATLSLTPGKHATLGLDAYTQGTSPIRRYGDLIIHRQFFQFMNTNKMCYSSDEVRRKISSIEKGEKKIKISENERYLFWFYKYLKQQKGKIYKGYVSKAFDNNRVLVFFPGLFQEFSTKVDRESYAKEGTEVSFRIQGASPRKQRLHLQHVIPN
ncbi:ribonuclease catalytic domain-containing protein [Candidatus Uabimicrobium sp. HlEnr_7]|uniref:ribonuclease catalytic domain-containing protein n=1 Tax=Candidatus Uabimicrobium helgolandensis TaxID=3095367 RepID=UPI003556D974